VYHNDGNGHFTEISHKAGLAEPARDWASLSPITIGTAISTSLLPTTLCPNSFTTNKGDGTFEEVALSSGVAVDGEGHTYAGMGVDFADYNNDGLPDLVVTDLASQMYALYRKQWRWHLYLR